MLTSDKTAQVATGRADNIKQHLAQQVTQTALADVAVHDLQRPGRPATADGLRPPLDEEMAPSPAGGALATRVSFLDLKPPHPHSLPPQYSADVEQFCSWWAQQGKNISDDKLAPQDIERYLAWLASPGHDLGRGRTGAYALSTIARKRSAVGRWLDLLVRLGRLTHNPAAGIRVSLSAYKPTRRPALAPAVVETIPATTPVGIRDRAIAALLISGLSPAQVARLNMADLDDEAWAVTICSRGGRRRQVFLSEQAIAALKRWSAARRLLHPLDPEALFISLHWTAGRSEPRRRLSVDGLRRIVSKYKHGSRAKHVKRFPLATTS